MKNQNPENFIDFYREMCHNKGTIKSQLVLMKKGGFYYGTQS
jgi:hypothetical protein